MKMKWTALLLPFALLCGGTAEASTWAIVHARILSSGEAGDVPSGTIVVRDGKIVYVGPDIEPPAGATVIDGTGKVVTPGLIETDTPLGLSDLIDYGPTDSTQTKSSSVAASYDVQFGLNPAVPTIAEARAEGVTGAMVTPVVGNREGDARSFFAGTAAAIHLGSGASLLVKPHIAVVMNAGEAGASQAGGGRGAQFVALAAMLSEARKFTRARGSFYATEKPLSLSSQDLEVLGRVARGEIPLLVNVSRVADIRTWLAFAKGEKIRLILSGAEEAWLVADDIAMAGVPVVIDVEANQPLNFETLNASYANAAVLMKAGVLVAYKPAVARVAWPVRSPRFLAGRSVAHGVPYMSALAAITINPARIFGLGDRLGSLEPGKDADLVVWSGDPFEYSTGVEQVFIRGKSEPLTTRQAMLRERYRTDRDRR